MKKILSLFCLVAAMAFGANASVYIVGNAPFGDWNPAAGVEMTDNGDGTYSYTFTPTSATIWYVFSDELSSDWDTFNGTHRFGPTTGSDAEVALNTATATQKQGNGNGSYKTTFVAGEEYTITFDLTNLSFTVAGPEPGVVTEHTYTIAGTPASLFGTEWDPSNTANDMALQNGSTTVYEKIYSNVTLPAGNVEFKVTLDHSWGTAYPAGNYVVNVPDSGAYNLTITFNTVGNTVSATLAAEGEEPVTTYTVAGTPAAVFGTEWDPTNTANDMVLGEGTTYTLTKSNVTLAANTNIEFKVTENHAWNVSYGQDGGADNVIYAITADGTYDIVITFDSETHIPAITVTATGTPTYAQVYILGEVNDNGGWWPNVGTEMTTEDGIIYTADVTTLGQNINTEDGIGYSYFSFSEMLAADSTDWASIAASRFGAVSDGDFWVTDELLGTEIALTANGTANALRLPAGEWGFTLNLQARTLVITAVEPTASDINGDGAWSMADVTTLISYVLGNEPSPCIEENCDVNGDGNVSMADVTTLISNILGN